MNKDITNPGNKAISYAATLSSVVSLLPVRKPGTPCIPPDKRHSVHNNHAKERSVGLRQDSQNVPSLRANPHQGELSNGRCRQ